MKTKMDDTGKIASSIRQCVSESTGGISTVFLAEVKNGYPQFGSMYTHERRDALVKDLYDLSMKGYWISDARTLPQHGPYAAWIKVLVEKTSNHQTNIDAEIIDMLVKSLEYGEECI